MALPARSDVDIAGVNVADSYTLADRSLVLNGAGIRSRFFVKVYVGALYLGSTARSTEQVLLNSGPKSMQMMMLYKEVGASKIAEGWSDGFKANQSTGQMMQLQVRLEKFNALFTYVYYEDKNDGVPLQNRSSLNTDNPVNPAPEPGCFLPGACGDDVTDIEKFTQDFYGRNIDFEWNSYTLNMDYDVGLGVITAIFGYQDTDENVATDFDASFLNNFPSFSHRIGCLRSTTRIIVMGMVIVKLHVYIKHLYE